MKIVTRDKLIYSFSPRNPPVEYVNPGELILVETEDAIGGQIKSEKDLIEQIDWSRVDGLRAQFMLKRRNLGIH
jgi:amidase